VQLKQSAPMAKILFTARLGSQVNAVFGGFCADSDEAGHALQYEAGHLFRSEAGRGSDLKPATERSLPRIEAIMFRRGG